MAFDIKVKKRRRETMTTAYRRKLLENSKVEVRSTDEGFRGSWHCGTVIASTNLARWVQYDHLLSDENSSTKLVECVEVPSIFDGIANKKSQSNYRGWMRPLSPACDFSVWFLHYGQCVDVYYSDAWWEGVIMDHQDGSTERNVFFPDIGDEMEAHKDNLRISQDWDEQTELWKPRGNWLFLELIEEIERDWPILVSVKQIWYDVRARKGFDNLKEWTSCLSDIWRELLLEVIVDNFKLFVKDLFLSLSCSGNILHECGQLMELNGPVLDALLKNKDCFVDPLAVVPVGNGFLNGYESLHIEEREKYFQPCVKINRDKLAKFDRLEKMPLSSSVKTTNEEIACVRLEKMPLSTSVKPTNEKIACVSSRTMAIVPFMTGEMSLGNSSYNHEEAINTSHKVAMLNKNHVWIPVGPDIIPNPEYCPEAVEEYCKLFKSRHKRYVEVRFNVLKHLLFMDWKIEYRKVKKSNGRQRLRYIEPGSIGKPFVSLLEVCEYLMTGVSKEVSSRMDLKIPKENAQDNLVSFGVQAEFHEDAVSEYINITKCGRRPSEEHVTNVLKHLSFLGWKFEYIKDKRSYRFSPPSGKSFGSLFQVCQHLEKSSSAIVSMFPQNVQCNLSYVVDATLSPTEHSQECKSVQVGPSPGDEIICEPEYCPQAVMNYYSLGIKEKGDTSKWDTELKDMQLKAKKHLCAVGWKLYQYRPTKKLKYKYSSPSGKLYYTLRSACKGYIDEEINVGKLADVQLASEGRHSPLASKDVQKEFHRKHEKERKSSALNLDSLSSNSVAKENKSKKIQAIKSKGNLNSSVVSVSDRVLRSNKRAREVVATSSSHRNPRTILSWLIDNNVLFPEEKVQYRIGKNYKTIAEGLVTHDGIRCCCCQVTFTLRNFEVHANSTYCHQPSANIYLEDGRSLLECQIQLRRNLNARGSTRGLLEVKGKQNDNKTDYICSVCHFGGNLILCDGCPSSFHTRCLGLKGVPTGNWFCPSCCCKICGRSRNNGDIEVFTDNSVINCDQCARQYHIGCLRMKGLVLESYPKGFWFCNMKCEQISFGLQKLLGKRVQIGMDNLTWTLLKHTKPDNNYHDQSDIADSTEMYSKLSVALDVMHECFEPVKDPRTRRDLVEDVIFSRRSKLHRLNFHGFYTVLLERNDELITAATLRVHGEQVAEIPLVATRVLYRRRGMCRVLMNELEKVLVELGVQRIVLPAVPSVLNTWISSFGFSRMSPSERLNFLDYTFLNFQGTTMCQKLLLMTPSIKSIPPSLVKQHSGAISGYDIMDFEGSSGVSEILQTVRVEENGAVGQTSINLGAGICGADKVGSDHLVSHSTGFEYVPCQNGEIGLESSGERSDYKENKNHGNGQIICYKRRRILKPVGAEGERS